MGSLGWEMFPALGIAPCIGVWGSETFLALGITVHWYLEVQDSHRPSDHGADVGGWKVSLSLAITTCGQSSTGTCP